MTESSSLPNNLDTSTDMFIFLVFAASISILNMAWNILLPLSPISSLSDNTKFYRFVSCIPPVNVHTGWQKYLSYSYYHSFFRLHQQKWHIYTKMFVKIYSALFHLNKHWRYFHFKEITITNLCTHEENKHLTVLWCCAALCWWK